MLADNLQILAETNPALAECLASLDEFAPACQTRHGESNIQVKSWPVHSQYSAVREAKKLVGDLDLGSADVLCVYGVGLGYIYDELEEWLHGGVGRYLVFFEDDLLCLRSLLNIRRGTRILQDPQVQLHAMGDSTLERELAGQAFAQYFVNLCFKTLALPSYMQRKAKAWQELQSAIMHKSAQMNFASIEFMNCGASFFQNYYRNVRSLPDAYRVTGLYQRFTGIPAIICGAGPSLNKNHSLLKTLRNRALIFAGGSAINALCNRGIMPHFGGSVDPNTLQYERMNTHTGFELPMFYKGRVYHKALRSFHGPHIHLSGNNGYPVSTWMESQLGLEDPSPHEGHNCLHLLIDLAREMGCDPIIFVGMDLAFTGMQSYSDCVVADAEVKEAAITLGTDLNTNAFQRKGADGEPVYTLWKWVAEANYTASYAGKFPETTFLNATEGGLGIAGIPDLSLREVKEKYLTRSWDLRGRVHAELQCNRVQGISPDLVTDKLRELQKSMERAIEVCKSVETCFKQLARAVAANDLAYMQALTQELETTQTSLMEELAYGEVLTPLNQIRSLLYERSWEEIQRDSSIETEQARMLALFEHQREEAASLHYAAQVNFFLLTQALQEDAPLSEQAPSAVGEIIQPKSVPVMNGPIEYKYANGQLASRAHWNRGQRHGPTIWYYADGSVYAKLHYANGDFEGEQVHYYADGQCKTRRTYVKGILEGTVVLYHSNGGVKKSVEFANGTLDGVQREWNAEGALSSELHYRKGRLVLEQYWQHAVLLEQKQHLSTGQQNWRKWDSAGHLRFVEEFSGARFMRTEWNEKGQPARQYGGHWNGDFAVIEKLSCGELKPDEVERYRPLKA